MAQPTTKTNLSLAVGDRERLERLAKATGRKYVHLVGSALHVYEYCGLQEDPRCYDSLEEAIDAEDTQTPREAPLVFILTPDRKQVEVYGG